MANEKDKGKPKGKGRGKGKEKGNEGEEDSLGKHHGGNPVRIHEEYARMHLEGGEPATPETFERAAKQFHRLPGVVRTTATDVNLVSSEEDSDEASDTKEEDSEDDLSGVDDGKPDDVESEEG